MTGQVARWAGNRSRGIILIATGLVVVVALAAACSLVTKHLGYPTAIAAGSDHTCAVLSYDKIACWGDNTYGQLGDGTTEDRHTPVVVTGISDATAISAGSDHTCAVVSRDFVVCWGDNAFGQLGDGTTEDRHTPVVVTGMSDATAISAGSDYTCAVAQPDHVVAPHHVWCWGDNRLGQLGDGTTEDRHTPVVVTGISDVDNIAAGSGHTCAQLSDGTVWCWGDNKYGQLGDGTTEVSHTPVVVTGIRDATAISAGSDHTCAALVDHSVKCWGRNASGQLGDGTTEDRHTPVVVSGVTVSDPGSSYTKAIVAGGNHTCGVASGGFVWCWGDNKYGELGDGTTLGHSTAIEGVRGGAEAIAAGSGQTCVRMADCSVRCWGSNNRGQLGDGTTEDRHTDVTVMELEGGCTGPRKARLPRSCA